MKTNQLSIRYLYLTMDTELREGLADKVGHQIKTGDAILLTLPSNKHLLIDAGMPHAGPLLLKRLQELDVTKLDYVISTHPHWDHIGGFLTILPEIPVGVFYQSPVTHPKSEYYQELQSILTEQKIKVQELTEGDRLELDSLQFKVLNPAKEQLAKAGPDLSTAEINNLSLVLRLDYKDFSMLFTGDLYRAGEKVLLRKYGPETLHVDILDVPHHGRATSSMRVFIKTVDPQVAIISHDDPGQPREKRYRRRKIKVLPTADYGEILIETDGENSRISGQDLSFSLV